MKLLSAVFDLALLPLDLTKDVCTFGGAITNDDKSAMRERIEKVEGHLGMR